MKKIYICSPLQGDYEQNIENAIQYCREVIREGHKPICPHIYYTRFLDDTNPKERELGMKYGLMDLEDCDMIYVYGKPSEGMKAEIELANELRIGVVYRC